MRNILIFLTKYNSLFVFIILELVSLNLIIKYNNRQNEIFLYSSNLVTGYFLKEYNQLLEYFSLKDINAKLKEENAQLIEKFYNQRYKELPKYDNTDSLETLYNVIPATICNKSIDKRNNRITIDRGRSSGIKKGMGVIDSKGIVGVVSAVNEKFASIIPLNNTLSRTSVLVKNKEYFGILKWDPYDYRFSTMTTVPKYADVIVGDSIITSGFSTIFPRGVYVGKVAKISEDKGTGYLNIKVRLVNDLGLIQNVYMINDKDKKYKLMIEKQR